MFLLFRATLSNAQESSLAVLVWGTMDGNRDLNNKAGHMQDKYLARHMQVSTLLVPYVLNFCKIRGFIIVLIFIFEVSEPLSPPTNYVPISLLKS